MKSTSSPTIVFAIFLTIWVHVTVGVPSGFDRYIERLKDEMSSSLIQPNFHFKETKDLLEKLENTSDHFKEVCVVNDKALHRAKAFFAAVSALNKAIADNFKTYKTIAGDGKARALLNEIESEDPISFLVFLNHPNSRSKTLVENIEEYARMSGHNIRRLPNDFDRYIERLKDQMSTDIQPNFHFKETKDLLEKLENTSDHFKEVCVVNDKTLHRANTFFAAVSALNKAIADNFKTYKTIAGDGKARALLNEIESEDPISFLVFLNHPNSRSKTLVENIEEYVRMLENNTGPECPICLQPMKAGTSHPPTTLECGHVFGRDCINDWINYDQQDEITRWIGLHPQEKNTCPLCRKAVVHQE